MGVVFMLLGIRMLLRKPFLIPSWWVWALVIPVFLPGLVIAISNPARTLVGAWAPLLLLPVLVWIIVRGSGHVMLFNITEAILYEGLGVALRMQGVAYEESRTSILLTEAGGAIRITFQQAMYTGVLRFTNRRAIPDYHAFLADFNAALRTWRFEHFSWLGVVYVVLALVSLAMSLFRPGS